MLIKQEKTNLNIWSKKHTLNHWIRPISLSPCIFAPQNRPNDFFPDLASPNSVFFVCVFVCLFVFFFQKWYLSLLSVVMIMLQVRVLRLTKMHDYLNVPPYIICTPCIIWFRHGTSRIFRLWTFRKFIFLRVPNGHNLEYAPLKQNRCIFLYYFGVKHFFLTYIWLVTLSIVCCGVGQHAG